MVPLWFTYPLADAMARDRKRPAHKKIEFCKEPKLPCSAQDLCLFRQIVLQCPYSLKDLVLRSNSGTAAGTMSVSW